MVGYEISPKEINVFNELCLKFLNKINAVATKCSKLLYYMYFIMYEIKANLSY